jgi:hypothetical protein
MFVNVCKKGREKKRDQDPKLREGGFPESCCQLRVAFWWRDFVLTDFKPLVIFLSPEGPGRQVGGYYQGNKEKKRPNTNLNRYTNKK